MLNFGTMTFCIVCDLALDANPQKDRRQSGCQFLSAFFSMKKSPKPFFFGSTTVNYIVRVLFQLICSKELAELLGRMVSMSLDLRGGSAVVPRSVCGSVCIEICVI